MVNSDCLVYSMTHIKIKKKSFSVNVKNTWNIIIFSYLNVSREQEQRKLLSLSSLTVLS